MKSRKGAGLVVFLFLMSCASVPQKPRMLKLEDLTLDEKIGQLFAAMQEMSTNLRSMVGRLQAGVAHAAVGDVRLRRKLCRVLQRRRRRHVRHAAHATDR